MPSLAHWISENGLTTSLGHIMGLDSRNYSARLVAGKDVDITEYPALCACCGRAINDGEVIINEVCAKCLANKHFDELIGKNMAKDRKQRIRYICEKGNFAISATRGLK